MDPNHYGPSHQYYKVNSKDFFLFYFYFIKVFYWCYECVAYIQLYCRLLIILIGIELPSIWADMNSRVAHFQLASRTTADHRLRTPATRAKLPSILCCSMQNLVNVIFIINLRFSLFFLIADKLWEQWRIFVFFKQFCICMWISISTFVNFVAGDILTMASPTPWESEEVGY